MFDKMARSRKRECEITPLISPSEVEITGDEGCCQGFKKRHILAVISSCGFFMVYAMRVNLSVALVAMVNNTAFKKADNPNDSIDCSNLEPQNSTYSWEEEGEFNWGPTTQGVILGSFFYGYVTTQTIGGYLAERFGGKWLFGVGVLITAILTILTPVAARTGLGFLIIVRILEGMGEGVTFPAMYAIWSKWAPKLERSTLTAISFGGSGLGTIVAFPISGMMCEYGFGGGWPSVFYVFGSVGCLWFVCWCFLAYDCPSVHPTISDEERRYITTSIGHLGPKQHMKVPWSSILTSRPVIALNITALCAGWGFFTMLTCIPTYLKEVLKLDITQNGLISALPFALNWICSVGSGALADCLQQRRIFRTTVTRKIMTGIAMLFQAGCLVWLTLVGCSRHLAITALSLSVGFQGFSAGGYSVNQIDLAPNFSGVLCGIANMFGTMPGIVGPFVAGVLTSEKQSRDEWNVVFCISAAILLFGVIVYTLFGSSDEQPWAKIVTPGLLYTDASDSADDDSNNDANIPSYVDQHNNHFNNPLETDVRQPIQKNKPVDLNVRS